MIQVEKTEKFKQQCGCCKCMLTYDHSDIVQHKTNFDYLGDYDIVLGIKCPVCGTVLKHE